MRGYAWATDSPVTAAFPTPLQDGRNSLHPLRDRARIAADRCNVQAKEEVKAMAEELACCGERCCPRCACTRGEACDCPDCPCCTT